MSAGSGGALRVRSALPGGGGPAAEGVSGQVCPAPRAGLTGGTKSCLTDTLSAAKPEKLANRCPLCHENFSPGEEVRASPGQVTVTRLSGLDRGQGAGVFGEHPVCCSAARTGTVFTCLPRCFPPSAAPWTLWGGGGAQLWGGV